MCFADYKRLLFLISGLVDKLGDIKVKKSASDCLTALASTFSLDIIFSEGKIYFK
jgi:hypothetical protein